VNDHASARPRVLVVDDEPLVGNAIRSILSDCDVTFETDPTHAVSRIVTGERFDLILCDLHMPALSGAQVLEAVTRIAPDLRRRFVYMTGGGFDEGDQGSLETAPGGHLFKPFTTGELRSVVKTVAAAA
jgi:CheY-like chemotaxis protein